MDEKNLDVLKTNTTVLSGSAGAAATIGFFIGGPFGAGIGAGVGAIVGGIAIIVVTVKNKDK